MNMTKLAVGLILALSGFSAMAADKVWTGAGGDGKWSNPQNWEGVVTEPALVNGDTLVFRCGAQELSMENDIDNLTVCRLDFSATDGVAMPAAVTLVGKALAISGTGKDTDKGLESPASKLSIGLPLTLTGSQTIYAHSEVEVLEQVTLDGAITLRIGGDGSQRIIFRSAVTGREATVRCNGNNSDVTFGGVVDVYAMMAGEWCAFSPTFNATGNRWVENAVGRWSAYQAKALNAYPTNMVCTWRSNEGGETCNPPQNSYAFDFDQLIDRVQSGPPIDTTGKWFDMNYLYSDNDATLTLRATDNASTECACRGRFSIVYDATGDFVQVFANRTHSQIGTITVRNGTFESSGTNTFAGVTRLSIGGTGSFRVTRNALGESSNPFPGTTELSIAIGGRMFVEDGTVTFSSATVKGVTLAAGSYQAVDGVDPTAEKVDWITGAGQVRVATGGAGTWWKAAKSGAWDDAANWTAGVPTSETKAYVTADGGDYVVSMGADDVLPKTLTIGNEGPGFAAVTSVVQTSISSWNWTVSRHGRLAFAAGANVDCNAGGALVDGVSVEAGGEFSVVGGMVRFANFNTANTSAIPGFRVKGGVVVADGLLRYRPAGDSPFYLDVGALLSVAGGTFSIPSYPNETFRPQAGSVHVTGSGQIDLSTEGTRWCNVSMGNLAVDGSGILAFKDASYVHFPPSGSLTTVLVSESAKLAGLASVYEVGSKAGGRVVFDYSAATAQSGITYWLFVGLDDGDGEMNVSNGYFPVGAKGATVGGVGMNRMTPSGVTKGLLRVTGGAFYVEGTTDPGWGPGYLYGLNIGSGERTMATAGEPYLGRMEVSGGVVTNDYGSFTIGSGYASGEYVQTGGSFYDRRAGSAVVVGLAGGRGELVLSNGVFEIAQKNIYLGGADTNVFGKIGSTLVAAGYPIGRHTAKGCLSFAGGTFKAGRDIILGADGEGKFERIGSKGTISVSGDLILSNTLENASSGGTLVFKADANGETAPIVVDGKLKLGTNAHLVVDTGSENLPIVKCYLLDAKEGFEGDFASVTFLGASKDSMKLVRRGTSLIAKKALGLSIIIR